MAHPEQHSFFDKLKRLFPDHFAADLHVLEVGSQDINGSVRDLFPAEVNFLGLDLSMAKGVDWTIPGELVELPDAWADTSISTECFEHAHDWDKILLNMIRITKPSGLLILTFAGDGRATHGTVDSEEASSPFTTSYYKNLAPDDISEKIKLGYYFDSHGFEVNSLANDTYFWGFRSQNSICHSDAYWASPLDRLARAQGQLSQAVERHNAVRRQVEALQCALQSVNEEVAALNQKLTEATSALDYYKNQASSLRSELNRLKSSSSWKLTAPIRQMADMAKRRSSGH